MNRREIGLTGEKLAKSFLKKKGYKIYETNFRCSQGEIDIVARCKDYLVFIEVRTKTNTDFGIPEESITLAKKQKIVKTALTYINSHKNLPVFWRVDFVAVEIDQNGKVGRLTLIENIIN